MRTTTKFLALTAAVALTAGATGVGQVIAQGRPVVKVDGSSTVFPITEAMAEEFQKIKKGQVQVTVGVSGTGGGFKKFCNGETDISNASRPIAKREIDACRGKNITYLELPVAFDALTVVINPKNTWVKSLSPAQLKTMWQPAAQGKIRTWKQVDASFPDRPLRLFAPGVDSGTFDYFTEAINGKSRASRSDFTASEDDNVLVQGVTTDINGLAYFGFAYYEENAKRLKAVPIVNSQGRAILPTRKSVDDGSYNPLSRPIFIYVNAAAMRRPEVREFAEFYQRNAVKLVPPTGYVPLPSRAYAANLDIIRRGRTGTVFGGENRVGLTIDQLMKLERVN
ncbi:phosphate binding protein [Gloeomargarita lithophora Alchichica-D10]|uniref:Phosphate-binding protein n=1 Tax=Gloeomargarita lithophora Alchichica-D10 TaxID=1188229 RepID=A0A1J0AF16_9CYAN|nr:PstS family phosphate ABC transporter substrate-binding protein [Gloeomargarita lithophora]APB34511.1 phosphate binding protein [Gloeomargarita lithophora Alchichica-D10]